MRLSFDFAKQVPNPKIDQTRAMSRDSSPRPPTKKGAAGLPTQLETEANLGPVLLERLHLRRSLAWNDDAARGVGARRVGRGIPAGRGHRGSGVDWSHEGFEVQPSLR